MWHYQVLKHLPLTTSMTLAMFLIPHQMMNNGVNVTNKHPSHSPLWAALGPHQQERFQIFFYISSLEDFK